AVGPGVFTPRPETELLVEWGLGRLRDSTVDGSLTVVDLCSGSGAIACAGAGRWPDGRGEPVVYAVEADPGALEWLRRNTKNTPVTVIRGDATQSATLRDLDGNVDLVLTNPPYVPTMSFLPPEVAEYDPAMALFGGKDGLEVIRPLIDRAARLLRRGGWLAMEHDDVHGESVPELLRTSGMWRDVAAHTDLAGRPRFVTATRA
ncbi:MAG: peptide chain release factor N(5)-glutamine methyltransferase, partial [Longispora sp.]|nr:peptide chain release factor N(5)-glutamine methyltransferase [Longispora sp. (in: high G+C Gram-positive bacteria)]